MFIDEYWKDLCWKTNDEKCLKRRLRRNSVSLSMAERKRQIREEKEILKRKTNSFRAKKKEDIRIKERKPNVNRLEVS